MFKFFEYDASRVDTEGKNIVDSILNLARQSYANKKDADYETKNRYVCGELAKYALQGSAFAADNGDQALENTKKIMARNGSFRERFNLILSQVVTAIVPEVNNDAFSRYIAEVHQIGYGDTSVFQIGSNDLFAVKEKAEGIRRGVDQPMFDDEITVNAHPVTIDAHIDWYPFAAGRVDMGNFALKIAKSFSAYVFIKAVKGMLAVSSESGSSDIDTATKYGAAYTVNGVGAKNWGTLRERVSAANGGMGVIAIGTAVALSSASLEGNYQVQIGEEMNKVGYLDQYLNTPLIAIDNVLVPGTTNTTAELALPDDRIFMVPVAGDKPVKIVFEGHEVAVEVDPEHTSDVRYGLSIEMRVGISAVCGSKYGTIKLA